MKRTKSVVGVLAVCTLLWYLRDPKGFKKKMTDAAEVVKCWTMLSILCVVCVCCEEQEPDTLEERDVDWEPQVAGSPS